MAEETKKGKVSQLDELETLGGGESLLGVVGGNGYQITVDTLKKYIGGGSGSGGSVDLTKVASDVVPTGDNTYSLGKAGNAWKAAHVKTLVLGTTIVSESEESVVVMGSSVVDTVTRVSEFLRAKSRSTNDSSFVMTEADMGDYAKKGDIPSLSSYATKVFVNDKITVLQGGASTGYDTLGKLESKIKANAENISKGQTKLEAISPIYIANNKISFSMFSRDGVYRGFETLQANPNSDKPEAPGLAVKIGEGLHFNEETGAIEANAQEGATYEFTNGLEEKDGKVGVKLEQAKGVYLGRQTIHLGEDGGLEIRAGEGIEFDSEGNIKSKITQTYVTDSLTSDSTTNALSAKQGNVLNGKISNLTEVVSDKADDSVVVKSVKINGETKKPSSGVVDLGSNYVKENGSPSFTKIETNSVSPNATTIAIGSGVTLNDKNLAVGGSISEGGTLLSNKYQPIGNYQPAGDYLTSANIGTAINDAIANYGFATVATTGSYNDLLNKPSIPTIDTLINDGLATRYDVAEVDAKFDNYLPLSGGILSDSWSGDTEIRRRDNDNGYASLKFSRADGTLLGRFGFGGVDNPLFITQAGGYNTLIHTGNIGSYAFIPKLDNLISNVNADNYLSNGAYLNQTGNGSGSSNFPQEYAMFLTFTNGSSNYVTQLDLGRSSAYYRTKIDTWSDWKQFITSDNIGSQSVNYANGTANILSKQPQLAAATEYNTISIVDNSNGSCSWDTVNEPLASITKAIQFGWYGHVWHIGGIRGGGDYTDWFGITHDKGTPVFRIHRTGNNAFLGSNAIIHSGNYSEYIDFDGGIAFTSNIAKIDTDWMNDRYLPLSGGAVNGSISVSQHLSCENTLINKGHFLFARGNNNADWIVTDKDWQHEYNLIHSGNIGSQSVAAANKLSTSRTIWGQSFDGSGNVSGVLTLPLNHQVQWADSGGAMIYGTSSKRIIIDGNVGIGTQSPTVELDVRGTIAAINKTYGDYQCIWRTDAGYSLIQALQQNVQYLPILLNPEGGNVGIGTYSPKYKLDVNGTARISGEVTITGGNDLSLQANSTSQIDAGDIVFKNSSGTELGRIWLDASANLQLSLRYGANDTFKRILHSGNLSAYLGTGLTWAAGAIALDFTESDPVFTASAAYSITNTNKSNWNTAYSNWTNGVSSFKTDKIVCKSNNDYSIAIGSIRLSSDITDYSMYPMLSSNLYMSLGAEDYSFYQVYAYNYNNTSDATKKNILGDVNLSVNSIANAPAKVFTWKDLPDKRRKVGTIAQYWQNVLPEVVSGSEGSLSMNYAELAVVSSIVIARSVETHAQRIERLEQEIATMQEELKILKGKGGE